MKTNDQSQQGYAPTVSSVVDFQRGDSLALNAPKQSVVSLSVPRSLKKRRIYCYLSADVGGAGTNYYVIAEVVLSLSSTIVGRIPQEIGIISGATNSLNQSLVAMATSSSTSGFGIAANIALIEVVNPTGSQLSSVVAVPLEFSGEIDNVTVNINSIFNVTNMRVFLGVMSLND
jgi:hypothetical protein